MFKTMKMSKYNFVMRDQNGNMIIYIPDRNEKFTEDNEARY